MKLPPLIPARFVRRDNRFRVTVELAGEPVAAHLPNSGRLPELLTSGRRCWLVEFDDPRRKTRFDLKLMAYAGTLVSVDSRLPNPLFAEAVAARRLEPFHWVERVDREVRLGDSRLDFYLEGSGGICWVETKSVTLVQDGVARFPDAPTERGTRHVRELITAVGRGERAAAVFVIQRADAVRFTPHDQADAAFGAALRDAAHVGVGVYAWTCQVSLDQIMISAQLPVELA